MQIFLFYIVRNCVTFWSIYNNYTLSQKKHNFSEVADLSGKSVGR